MARKNNVAQILTDRVSEMICSKCSSILDVLSAESFSTINCPACGTSLTVPAKLGSFLLVRLLGTGGMGAIYHAIDEALGRHVAIKVMLKSLGDDTESMETFQREARMLAALNHPNIVQIYTLGQERGQPYIVMELVSGKRLNEMIAKGEPLDQGMVLQIAIDVTLGLKAAYEIGILHGDIKPENILLDAKGTAKVVDFGLASFADKQASTQGVWGTPYYIAPEKIRKQPVDARSDIYSLGATLYHALTAVPPFDGETPVEIVKARLGNAAKPLYFVREDIFPKAEAIVLRMLKEDPSWRYPNYASLLGDLQDAAEELKKISGPLAIEPGKRVVTKKAKRVKADSGELEEAAPTISRLVMTKKYKKPLSADMAPETGEPSDEHSRPRTTSTRLQTALIALAIIGGILGIGGTFNAVRKHMQEEAERIRLTSITAEIQKKYAHAEASAKKTQALAESLHVRARQQSKQYKSNPNAAAIASNAFTLAAEAIEKSDQLQSIINETGTAVKNAKDDASVSAAKSLLERVSWLNEEIDENLRGVYDLLNEASREREKPKVQTAPEPVTSNPPATEAETSSEGGLDSPTPPTDT